MRTQPAPGTARIEQTALGANLDGHRRKCHGIFIGQDSLSVDAAADAFLQRLRVEGSAMKCVMVVDDDRDIRECVAAALQMQGYAVRTAANGRDALEQLMAMDSEPCLVLLDMTMPVMDGAQFLGVVGETRQLAALPVVVVSGHPEGVPGARRILRKPVPLDLLLRMVREVCGEA